MRGRGTAPSAHDLDTPTNELIALLCALEAIEGADDDARDAAPLIVASALERARAIRVVLDAVISAGR